MQIIIDPFTKVTNKDLFKSGRKAQLGYVYKRLNKGDYAREVRCPICGVWVRYDEKEKVKMINGNRWDFEKRRMGHCGSSNCSDDAEASRKHWKLMAEDREYWSEMTFKRYLKSGLVF